MDRKLAQEEADRRSVRLNQVKGADRSEKIRTYNYPQVRVSAFSLFLVLLLKLTSISRHIGTIDGSSDTYHDERIGRCDGRR